jgi:peroxiredoxin (alkyl hydroperoxide reductase subunit C)
MCGPAKASVVEERRPAVAEAAVTRSLPRIGDVAPDFTAQTTHGEITLSKWQEGMWVVLFPQPADFPPVCSTELVELGRRFKEFEQRGVKLVGISVDSIHSHLAWVQNLQKILGVRLPYPLIADSNRAVSETYGMMHPGESATVTVRALFFIDPKRTIRAIIYYPLNVGRSVDEISRVVDALQTADGKAVACPVNWKPGDKVIIPPPKTEKEVDDRLALQGVERLDFYLTKKAL